MLCMEWIKVFIAALCEDLKAWYEILSQYSALDSKSIYNSATVELSICSVL